MKRLLALAVLLGGTGAGATDDGTEALVIGVTAAYGQAERLDRLDAYRVVGRTTARMRGGEAGMRRDLQAPMRLRVDLAYPDRREVRILDRDRGWRGGPDRADPVTGIMLDSMAYQFLRSDIPRVLVAHASKLEDLGAHTRGDESFRLLRLRWSEQLAVDYWVQATTHRVTRVEGHIRHGELGFGFATEYSDFREVDGLLFPFHEENYAGGRHVATTIVDSVTLDPERPGPFAPPSRATD